jgi:hypothetical protein
MGDSNMGCAFWQGCMDGAAIFAVVRQALPPKPEIACSFPRFSAIHCQVRRHTMPGTDDAMNQAY